MRVLTFTSLFPNSMQPNKGIFVQQRMSAVNECVGVDVRVIAPVPYYPNLLGPDHWRINSRIPKREYLDGMIVDHPRYIVTPKIGMSLYGVSMFLGVLPTVRRLYKEFQFDLIDAHFVYPDGLAALLLGKYFGLPVVVSARGTDINMFPELPYVGWLLRKTLRDSRGVFAVSQGLKDAILHLGIPSEKIKVIPNGINPSRFFRMNQHQARHHIGINQQGKVLISVGNLVAGKGMHLLIEALALLFKQKHLDFHTYILGQGGMRSKLKQTIYDLELNDKVTLVGLVPNEQLVYWYNAADLFFLGSSSEGWPNVVCEALACGTPVIASNIPGMAEVINHRDIGIMADRTSEGFASAIADGMKKEWNFDFIHSKGQSRTWDQVAAEVAFSFKEMVF